MNHIKKYFFLYTLIISSLIVGALSYNHFILKGEYIVEYEIPCSPKLNTCFVGCDDQECNQKYYFALIQKNKNEVYAACGQDVTTCSSANACTDEDTFCNIVYCSNDSFDDCSTISD